MLGVFPAVYDFALSQLLKNAAIPDLAVFYLPGPRTSFVLMNTVEDMQAQRTVGNRLFIHSRLQAVHTECPVSVVRRPCEQTPSNVR